MKEIGLAITMFFNSFLGGVDPQLSNDRGTIESIKKEIKKIELLLEYKEKKKLINKIMEIKHDESDSESDSESEDDSESESDSESD